MSDSSDFNKKPAGISRREFMGRTTVAAAAAAGFMIVPRHVLGGKGYTPPSDKLNIGCIGTGGKGTSDIQAVSTENVVALTDVDDTMMLRLLKAEENSPEQAAMFAKAAKYRDFRQMLEKEKSLDAVTVSTPDHTHAVAAMMAIKMKKHVFVQKPLTHTVKEARLLTQEAKKMGIVSQMGNQGHSKEGARLVCEWIW
ncbi:MAG TPA: Gfo/Idh/MocA family oxidoreductase, partial [Candidatus Aminicenantes bacterium]|nr:Gfo/Idh/MocA family oxidoreductase [Candidatus Aminicenantes bacterium]